MEPRPYGPFPYLPINRRPELRWPGGARIAVWVIPNIEFFALNEQQQDGTRKIPDVPAWAKRDYGNRVGIFRLMDIMNKRGFAGTVALNSNVCDMHPEIIEAAKALDWEFMGHNESNTRRLTDIPADAEEAAISATLDRIEKAVGRRPRGWLSSGLQETWNTLDYLATAGIQYVADWVNDDQPYRMDVGGIVSIPYSLEINDKPAYDHHGYTPDEFSSMIKRQFDVLYEEGKMSGRVMAIALHPYISGVPHRISALDAALAHIRSRSDVWCATGAEIVDHYVKSVHPR